MVLVLCLSLMARYMHSASRSFTLIGPSLVSDLCGFCCSAVFDLLLIYDCTFLFFIL